MKRMKSMGNLMWLLTKAKHHALAMTAGSILVAAPLLRAEPVQAVSSHNPILPLPAGGDGNSVSPWIGADGRFVLFSSSANDLVPGDNSQMGLDLFLRDNASNTTVLVSANCFGTGGGNGNSLAGQVSTNGRYVVFQSDASDLLPGDTNGVSDIFVRDLQTGSNILVSVAADGSWGNGASTDPVMTPDGRYVAFLSAATNLVAGDANGIADIFVRDLIGGTTRLVSTNASGVDVSAPAMTPDGRFVAYACTTPGFAAGLAASPTGEVYVCDLVSNKTIWASTNAANIANSVWHHYPSTEPCFHPAISDDGRYVAFKVVGVLSSLGSAAPAMTFQFNATNGTVTAISSNGLAPWPQNDDVFGPEMSPDGRFVVFVVTNQNAACSLIQLWDAQAGTNLNVSVAMDGSLPTNSISDTPAVSADGRFVVFMSNATNLVANAVSNGFHLYRRDVQAGTTRLIDADTNGVGSEDELGAIPALSADGGRVAFAAPDGALVGSDNNNALDVFLWNATAGTNSLVSARSPLVAPQTGNAASSLGQISVSGNGELAAFASFASDLVTNDFNGDADVFVHDLTTGTNILVSVGLDGNSGSGGGSFNPCISADGRYVVFASGATNLVAGDTNGVMDIFRRDLQTGTTAMVSLGSTYDATFFAMSQDGRYVAFLCRTSVSTAQTALFWRDMESNSTYAVSGNVSNQAVTISADGKRLAYLGVPPPPYGGPFWLYVWDAHALANIYTNSNSAVTSAAISPLGNRLLYQASGGLYVHDLVGQTNLFVCPSTAPIRSSCAWSGDGRYVAFVTATNLVTGDGNGTNDVYLLDYQTGTLTQVSVDQTGASSAAGVSDSPAVSEDGRFVAFRSFATNVLPGIVRTPSLVLFDRLGGTNSLLATGTTETGWTSWVSKLTFGAGGSRLAFQSWDAGLVSADLNGAGDVFAGDLSGWRALDSDGDGIPDWWMIEYFGHPIGQASDLSLAQDDADGTGMSNLQKYLAGLNPTDPTSVLAIDIAADATGTNEVLNWTAASGKNYQVLSTTNFNDSAWPVLPGSAQAGSAAAIGGQRYFSTPVADSQRYFRLQVGN